MNAEKQSISERLIEAEKELIKDPKNEKLISEIEELKKDKAVEDWLNEINESTIEKASELEVLLNCEIKPFVFAVEPLKDAAIGFFKVPDARQSLKIYRLSLEDIDSGSEMIAKAQLVREYNGDVVSDPRFMDVNGKYDVKDSVLNFSLLLKAQSSVQFFYDQFKKK